MTEVVVRTEIAAPPAVAFDLARDASFHSASLPETDERVVDRPLHPLLALGDEVEFEGRHFGLRFRHRARITAFDRPRHFRDEMVRGAFRRFDHDHLFEATPAGTLMTDRVRFMAPLWPLGVLVERWVLAPHLRRLLASRGRQICAAAERAAR